MKKDGDYYHRFFLAMAYKRLSESQKARGCFDETVQWMDNGNRGGKAFRREAEEVLEINKERNLPADSTESQESKSTKE